MTWSPLVATALPATAPELSYVAGLGFTVALGGEVLQEVCRG
jgi:hypothetical protein